MGESFGSRLRFFKVGILSMVACIFHFAWLLALLVLVFGFEAAGLTALHCHQLLENLLPRLLWHSVLAWSRYLNLLSWAFGNYGLGHWWLSFIDLFYLSGSSNSPFCLFFLYLLSLRPSLKSIHGSLGCSGSRLLMIVLYWDAWICKLHLR